MTTKAQRPSISIREEEGRREVLDIVRNRWVALTPEEWVRQQVVQRLHYTLGYPLELMQVEGAITLNGMTRRCDIVVFATDGQPRIIVECKRPDVPINQKVCDQACRYNTVLQVPLLMITNGRQTSVLEVDFEKGTLHTLPEVPRWNFFVTK